MEFIGLRKVHGPLGRPTWVFKTEYWLEPFEGDLGFIDANVFAAQFFAQAEKTPVQWY